MMPRTIGLRERKRLASMRHVQCVALGLFHRLGYEAVTIEKIAAEAEVGAASIFRYFGTKDRIVIWDEADEGQVARLLSELAVGPLAASLERFATSFDAADTETRKNTLSRMSLIAREPTLAAQAALNGARFGALIADALAARARQRSPAFAQRAAGRAAAELMSAAITEWSRRGGRVKLARLVAEAVEAVQAELNTGRA
jgi:AcrR family transcriptional regulator